MNYHLVFRSVVSELKDCKIETPEGLHKDKYSDERRTSIGFDEYDISMEDMVPNENTIIAMCAVPNLHTKKKIYLTELGV